MRAFHLQTAVDSGQAQGNFLWVGSHMTDTERNTLLKHQHITKLAEISRVTEGEETAEFWSALRDNNSPAGQRSAQLTNNNSVAILKPKPRLFQFFSGTGVVEVK